MSFVVAALAQEVSGAVFSTVLAAAQNLANNIGGDLAADGIIARFREVFTRRGLDRQVSDATRRAFDLFDARLNDPDLKTAMQHDPRFQTDYTIISTLADAALHPEQQTAQIAALAERLAVLYPVFVPDPAVVPSPRLQRAASVLIGAMHEEAAAIAPLREGLRDLLDREVLEHVRHLDTPPYAAGLYDALIHSADELQTRLGHRHIASAHLLYAVAAQPDGVAAGILTRQGVALDAIAEVIARKVGAHEGPVANGLTPTAAALLDPEARMVAGERRADHTRSEHVLEALARRVIADPARTTTLSVVFDRLHLVPDHVQAAAIEASQIMSRIQISLDSLDSTTATPRRGS